MNKLNLRYLALLGALAGVSMIPAQADINTNGTFLGSPGNFMTLIQAIQVRLRSPVGRSQAGR